MAYNSSHISAKIVSTTIFKSNQTLQQAHCRFYVSVISISTKIKPVNKSHRGGLVCQSSLPDKCVPIVTSADQFMQKNVADVKCQIRESEMILFCS